MRPGNNRHNANTNPKNWQNLTSFVLTFASVTAQPKNNKSAEHNGDQHKIKTILGFRRRQVQTRDI